LKNFVEGCAREGCGHSRSEHKLERRGTGPCRHDADIKKAGFIPQTQVCNCRQFLARDCEPKIMT
jgi:hypothetical protein